ncbi:MAG: ammonium transporter [Pseudomonadota bacterium]
MRKHVAALGAVGAVFAVSAGGAYAQTGEVASDTSLLISTMFVLISGFLVMWMSAGFTMLEAGMVRSRNVAMQLAKNIGLFSVAGLSFFVIGFALQNPDGLWAVEGLLSGRAPGHSGVEAFGTAQVDEGAQISGGANFFFQLMFCAATASIVSGAVAERVRLWPFMIFVALMTGIIYPVQAAWTWGGGFLADLGFVDHAGSVVVHTVGGWAALAGVIILGPRVGKFSGGRVNPMPGSSLPLSTLGVFILWLGWFGFNGGSAFAAGTIPDMISVGRVIVNTNAAAGGGALAAMLLTQAIFRKVDLTMVMNGALAGLVSITAEPTAPGIASATLIGAVGGAIVVFVVPLLDRLRIDDVVGAIPVHLGAGLWGGLIAGITNPEGSIVAQFVGIGVIGLFVFSLSIAVWFVLRAAIGLRFPPEVEIEGLDINELGMEAYPEFVAYSEGN